MGWSREIARAITTLSVSASSVWRGILGDYSCASMIVHVSDGCWYVLFRYGIPSVLLVSLICIKVVYGRCS